MARINIEDSIFRDARFLDLVLKLGDSDRAIGILVRAWRIAQDYWYPNKQLIPNDVWHRSKLFEDLIDVGLAVKKTDGIYICGSEDQFQWLFEKSEAGKKSAVKRREKYGSAQPTNGKDKRKQYRSNTDRTALNTVRTLPNTVRTLPNSLEAHSLPPPILAPQGDGVLPPDSKGILTKEFIGYYCESFKIRYQTNPVINGKAAGIASRLIKDLGIEKAKTLVGVYLSMNDQYYLARRHDLVTFEANLNAVQVKHDTGNTITRAQSISAERDENNALALKKALERLNESSEIGI